MNAVLTGLLLGIALISGCTHGNQKSSSTDTIAVTPKQVPTYQLKWSDEFDGNAIDTTNWSFEKGGGGWGNNEQQFYQSQNARIFSGNLVITARKESAGGLPYTSARLISKGKREFTYGRIEARIKLPQGQGQWPAFWMLGANNSTVTWPGCGEIDIMENTNTSTAVLATLHWLDTTYIYRGDSTRTTPTNYHIYRIDWTPKAITWFVDGQQFYRANIEGNINGTAEFHRPFFLLLNMAVGGNLPGQKVDQSRLPAKMYIDYVRVYQLTRGV
jgi:beta-glucanase (GH16 family)